jgi:hypothetical protein
MEKKGFVRISHVHKKIKARSLFWCGVVFPGVYFSFSSMRFSLYKGHDPWHTQYNNKYIIPTTNKGRRRTIKLIK